jgi:hypothetical protein
MMGSISTGKVCNELDIIHWNLDEFAASFPKPEIVARIFPIWVLLVDGKLVGWFHSHAQTLIYFTLHPETFSPRTFYGVARSMNGSFKAVWGDPLLVTNPGEFSDRLLSKVYLEKFPHDLYKIRD